MARPSPFADPEFTLRVAELFAAGETRAKMADVFGVSPRCISNWRKDVRVRREMMKLIEERVLEITRRVDSKIANILNHQEDLTVDELLKIRKEFLGGALRQQTEKADAETIGELQDWIETFPELAQQFADSVETVKTK